MPASLPTENRQIVLRHRPTGDIDPSLSGNGTFERKTVPLDSVDSLKDDHVIVKVLYSSIDPAMRGWLRDVRSYLPPVQIGEVMRSSGLGIIVASKSSKFKEGDYAVGTTGWQEYATLPAKTLDPCPVSEGIEPLDFLGPLGMSGQTAYWGMLDVGKLKGEGETVVVTGAAGSVGLVAVQIAKIYGAKVIAVAGGQDKCDWLKSEFGVDEALDYKAPDFEKTFREIVRKKYGYIDLMFDNVGGDMLDNALTCLKMHARIAFCGSVSQYNEVEPKGLKNYMSLIGMRGRLEGFIVFDYAKRFAEAAQIMTGWIREGKLRSDFTIHPGGLDALPEAMTQIFVSGGKKGKLVCKIADP